LKTAILENLRASRNFRTRILESNSDIFLI
jgi:hypothetical protein